MESQLGVQALVRAALFLVRSGVPASPPVFYLSFVRVKDGPPQTSQLPSLLGRGSGALWTGARALTLRLEEAIQNRSAGVYLRSKCSGDPCSITWR